MSAPSDRKPPPPKASRRWRMALVVFTALVLMPLVLWGCSTTSPVDSPRFQGSVEDQVYAAAWPITPLVLPPGSGGTGPLRYALGPPVPGLTFDADARTLTGTPMKAGTHHMTYMVRDGRKRTGHAYFTITIEEDAPDGLTSRYRGRGDQVFVLNPAGEELDEAHYTLDLGEATAAVYVIATNTADHEAQPTIERDDRADGAANGLPAAERDGRAAAPRPEASAAVAERKWITEFNNNPPLPALSGTRSFAGPRASASGRTRRAVAEGDRYDFKDRGDNQDLVSIPATARRVVTDGETTVALWVADREWGPACSGAGPCVTREMVDALAERFLRPGGGNDIHDWVTAIYGQPWGPHSHENLIPPDAAGEIHILLFDIEGDGAPQPGECRIVGFFWGVHNYPRNPASPFTQISAERLIFFLDSVFMALPEGPSWEVTDRRPSIVISTLAHEYQHMIHFYQKPVLRGAGSAAWLNEMASEVGEDLIADKLKANGPRGVAYDDPTAGAPGNERGRLPYYNLFNDIQVTAWGGRLANYGVNYALGAYLARTYGGAELFSEIVQSGGAGVDAIEAALAAGGHEVTFGEVLADWAVATLLSDRTAVPSRYRYNPGTWSTSHAGGEDYRLGSIDLHNYRYEPPERASDCVGPDLANRPAQEGPYLHTLESFNQRRQPPHSNMIATLGRHGGRVSLRVTAGGENRITVVVKQ